MVSSDVSTVGQITQLPRHSRRELCARLARLAGAAEPIPEVPPFGLIRDGDRQGLPDDAIDAYPLGQVQLGMIFHMMRDNAKSRNRGIPAAYHNVGTQHYRISEFSEAAFRESVKILVDRHEIFRTSFHISGFSEAIAIVHRACPSRITVFDLRRKSEQEKHELLAEFQAAQNATIVDLRDAPLIRFYVHVFTDHDIKLTVVEPHSISDGWSTHLTLAELIGNYHRIMAGEKVADPPLQLAYRQFIAEERAAVSSDAQRLFWHAFLANASDTKLPTRRVNPPGGERCKFYSALDKSLTHDVLELAKAQGLPTRTVLLAAHFKLLSLLSGSEDVLTGVSFNGRLEKPDGTELRGMFLNTLPMRLESMGHSWVKLLSGVYATECMILPFRRYPLSEILRAVGREMLPSTLFSFHHFHSVRRIQGMGVVDSMENITDESRTNFPFEAAFLRSAERADVFTMIIDVDPDRFTSSDVETFANMYCEILTMMTQDVHASHEKFAAPQCLGYRTLDGQFGKE